MKKFTSLWMMLIVLFSIVFLVASSACAAHVGIHKTPPTQVLPFQVKSTNTVATVKAVKAPVGKRLRSLKAERPSIVWSETATTNDQGQVTRILTGTKQDGSTITVCPLYNGWEVPFEFRQKILTIPEEDRQYLVSMGPTKRTEMQGSGDKPNVPVPASTDTEHTDEIRVIDLRW